MTVSISDLSRVTALALGDDYPLASAGARDTMKASHTQLLALMQANLVFTSAKPVQQFAAPTTGQTVTVATGDSWLVLTPAGTLATLTVTLPTDRTDGEIVRVSSSQIITALTVSGAGTALAGAPTTIAAGGFWIMCYTSVLNSWVRIG